MKAQKSYEEMIQFLIADYSYYSICPDGSKLDTYLDPDNSLDQDSEAAA